MRAKVDLSAFIIIRLNSTRKGIVFPSLNYQTTTYALLGSVKNPSRQRVLTFYFTQILLELCLKKQQTALNT